MEKPFLALDVDGPIAIFGKSHDPQLVNETWVDEIPVTLDRGIRSRLSVLHRHFHIVWSSSWQRSASLLVGPLVGLPEGLPYINFDHYVQSKIGESRKLPALKAWLKERPVAIVDDEIGDDMRAWATERASPTLLVEIDPRYGILDGHVVELLAFARRLSGSKD